MGFPQVRRFHRKQPIPVQGRFRPEMTHIDSGGTGFPSGAHQSAWATPEAAKGGRTLLVCLTESIIPHQQKS